MCGGAAHVIWQSPSVTCFLFLSVSVFFFQVMIQSSTDEIWFNAAIGIANELRTAKLEVLRLSPFLGGRFQVSTLDAIQRAGIRVVLVLAYGPDILLVATSARQRALSSGWAWMTQLGFSGNISKDIVGWIDVVPFFDLDQLQGFAEQVREYGALHFNQTISADLVDVPYAAALHDAIMLYAHAATKVLSQGGNLLDGQAVTRAVLNTSFTGIQNSVVQLDEHGNRMESYSVLNYQFGGDDQICSVTIGVYDRFLGRFQATATPVVWPGNIPDPIPIDYLAGRSRIELLVCCFILPCVLPLTLPPVGC